MLKGLLHIAIWGLLGLYMLITMGAVSSKLSHRVATDVQVNIVNKTAHDFFDKGDIRKILEDEGWNFEGKRLDSINTNTVEERLKEFAWLENAECYRTVGGGIKISVKQRTPIVRVMAGNQNYYMDKYGYQMPPGVFVAAHVPVVNGMVPDSLLRHEIIDIVSYLNTDDFLKAQIQQLYINSDKEFVLIPRAGKQEIVLGDANKIEQKFNKLIKLYQEEFGKNGWNRYRVIDLRFDNQVVCTKK